MRRFNPKIQAAMLPKPSERSPVRLNIPDPLGEKIRKAADESQISQKKLVAEAIRKGMEILGRI